MKFSRRKDQVNTEGRAAQDGHAESQPEQGAKDSKSADLSRLKKKDLLEIMLKQGEEIDTLRARVAELEAQLEKKEFDLSTVGNIAEASLVVTNVFEEAQKAALVYLTNVKRIADQAAASRTSRSASAPANKGPARGGGND